MSESEKIGFDDFVRTGPGTLAGRYLRQFWQPVAVSRELLPGRARPIRVMSEDYTLYRGDTGKAHVVAHRCPHRGTQLSVGYIEGDAIRCLYHGWKFEASGQCVDQPAERPELAAQTCIPSYPTEEFMGLVYAYFGPGAPPAFPPYPELEGEGVRFAFVERFPFNFFQAWENDWDIYHAAHTHRTGGLHGINYKLMLDTETFEETDFGVMRSFETGMGRAVSTLLMPTTVRLVIPAFNEESRRTGPQLRPTYLIHVPVDDHADLLYVTQIVPITGEAAARFPEEMAAIQKLRESARPPTEVAEDILAGRLSLQDVKDHPAFVVIEDFCAQGGQGRIADRRAEQLGRTDLGIALLRRIWRRELQAVAEGQPTKAWARLAQMPRGNFGERPAGAVAPVR